MDLFGTIIMMGYSIAIVTSLVSLHKASKAGTGPY